ncbi:MAG: Deoxycytidine triphosphate deaminase [Candidatus Heimdallarchaeota archaeon LC_3]|nr:MAG: Deoxycytidine triphosphate deaminase [Candidatus Heimdallarchaeota archaeon LC_3]
MKQIKIGLLSMTILSKEEIFSEIAKNNIKIDPFNPDYVGPCSIDLHLSDKFSIFKTGVIVDPDNRSIKHTEPVQTNGENFFLSPGHFILASTLEKISLSKQYAAFLEGRSYVARMGVVVHAAGLVNPGTGMKKPTTLTLEIHTSVPVYLKPGMGIIQIIFHRLSSEANIGYDERSNSHYIGLDAPRP